MADIFSDTANADRTQIAADRTSRLPATFGDSFDADWQNGNLFSSSIFQSRAREQALSEYEDRVRQAGGEIKPKIAPRPGTMISAEDRLDAANEAFTKLDLGPYAGQPMTMDDIQRRADELSLGARMNLQAEQSRPQTLGSKVGGFLGGAAAAATDPLNLPMLLLAPEAFGPNVLRAAMGWGSLSLAQQTANEAANMAGRERIVPGYEASGEPGSNILQAFVGGAVLGGTTQGFSNALTRMRTGAWPRELQDAARQTESEAQIAAANPLPGAEGEAEHRAAMSKAIDQIINGQRVDVDIAAASQQLMQKLEAERGVALPASQFARDEVARVAEEGALRGRQAEILRTIDAMPKVDQVEAATAADRLNRLDAVETQLDNPELSAERRKQLLDRRDQILVDTNPETLRRQAQPLEDRRALEQEHASLDARLNEIGSERAQARLALAQRQVDIPHERIPLGERSTVPQTLFDIHQQRIGDLAALRPREPTLFTPEQTAKMQAGVQDLARRAGYEMPAEEAGKLAARVLDSGDDEEARAVLNEIAYRPRTAAGTIPSAAEVRAMIEEGAAAALHDAKLPPASNEAVAAARPENLAKTMADPKLVEVQMADLRRFLDEEAKAGRQPMVALKPDENGEPIAQTLASYLDEIARDERAAKALQDACATDTEQGA